MGHKHNVKYLNPMTSIELLLHLRRTVWLDQISFSHHLVSIRELAKYIEITKMIARTL